MLRTRTGRLAAGRKLGNVVADIDKAGGTALAVALDVLDGESIGAAVARTEEHLGAIDNLVNNAGVAVQKPFLDQTEADWDAVVDTNLKGAFLVAQAVARRMAERQAGAIINITSMMAHATITQPTPYAASKGGLMVMTRNMALELARFGIRVNAIAPGYIGTEMTDDFFATPPGLKVISAIPMRRLGKLEDLDGPLLLLASDASRAPLFWSMAASCWGDRLCLLDKRMQRSDRGLPALHGDKQAD